MSSPKIISSVVSKCRKNLSSMEGQLHLAIIWVSSNRNIFDNKKVDALAKSEVSLNKSKAEIIPSLLDTIKSK